MKSAFIFTTILILAMASFVGAQESNHPEAGEKALGSYFATDIDSVSMTNGNLHLHIPIFSLSGREVPVSLALDYDSVAYDLRTWCTPNCTYGYEMSQWKKSSGMLHMGHLNYPTRSANIPAYSSSPVTIGWTITAVWESANGSRYVFTGVKNQTCTSVTNYYCVGASPSDNYFYDNVTLETKDSEFVQLTTGTIYSNNPTTPAYVTFKNGNRFQVALSSVTPLLITPNGNYVQANTDSSSTSNYGTPLGDYVAASDTLGRTVGYQKSNYTETITLTDANGQSQVYQIVSKVIHGYSNKEGGSAPGITGSYGPGITLDADFIVVDYVQLPNGKRYTFTYNPEGMVSQVTLPSGGYIKYEYEHPYCRRGYVARRIVSDGTSEKQTSYSYNFQVLQGSFNCPGAVYSYYGDLLDTTVTDPAGNKVQHIFSTTNHLETATLTISSTNQVLQRVDRTWSTTSNPHIDVETVTMPDVVRKTQYTYDSYNNVTKQEDFDWGTLSAGGRLRYVDKTYLMSACTSNHICTKVTSEKVYTGDTSTLVAETDYEYDNYTSPNTLVSRSGTPGWTSPSGTTRGNLTAVKQWVTGSTFLVTTNQYDVLGNKVKVTDPGGHVTDIDFADNFSDSSKNGSKFAYPKRTTDPSLFYLETTYDYNTGLVTQTKDSLNRTSTKTYDSMNRELQENYPNGGFTRFTYNDTALTAKKEIKVDAAGNLGTVIAHYDGLYRETQKETYDPEGTIFVDTQYDVNGRKWKVSNPYRSGTPIFTQFAYDGLGRPSVTTAPDNSTVQYAYNGNQTTVTDEAGNQRRYTYDSLGRMAKVEEPNSSLATPLVTTYQYNVLGKLTLSNQSNQTRTWAFDALGRLTTETLPESGTASFTYNSEGLLATKTDARGMTTNLSYDSLHRVTSRSYTNDSSGTPAVTFGYDVDPNDSASLYPHLKTFMRDGMGCVKYKYDSMDRLTQEIRILGDNTTACGNNGFSTSYVYNIKGDLTQMTYPSGRAVEFKYATGGGCCNSRLEYVKDLTTGAKVASGLTFNAAGELLTRTLNPDATAISETFSYNNRLQETAITAALGSTTVMNFNYDYGTSASNTGRVLSRKDDIQPEHSMVYAYDSIYRLSQAISQDTSWDISWAFDVWGNRTSQTPRGLATSKVGTQTSGYSNNRQTCPQSNPNCYDAAGNQSYDGNHNYTFNAENRITQMDGGAATYGYDGEGRRMKKTVGAETTYYFYGPGGLLCEFSTTSGVTSASSTDRATYRTADKLGSAVLILSSAGLALENNRTLPYGEVWLPEVASTNEKKFTTYQRDQESGLDYAMGRYLANLYGRFVSGDPGKMVFEVPSTLNRYAYTINDPINYTDPDGRFLGFIGSFGNWVGRVLGFVQAVAPLAASAANGFQSTQVKPDKNWELNRLALIAAWGAAIAAQENEPGQPYKLVVESDCYLRGGSASVGGLFNPGVARRRTYAVEDIKGNLIRGVTVQETNHVYGTNGLNSGNAYFSTGILATFQDNIWTNAVVNQDQEFHIGDRKLIIEEKDGTQHGTLGIYSDRNVVIINGDDGRDAKGNLKYCP